MLKVTHEDNDDNDDEEEEEGNDKESKCHVCISVRKSFQCKRNLSDKLKHSVKAPLNN